MGNLSGLTQMQADGNSFHAFILKWMIEPIGVCIFNH